MNYSFYKNDISEIVKKTKKISNFFSGKRIIITGGNGFLGKYFVEVFKEFNQYLKKPMEVIVFDVTLKKK